MFSLGIVLFDSNMRKLSFLHRSYQIFLALQIISDSCRCNILIYLSRTDLCPRHFSTEGSILHLFCFVDAYFNHRTPNVLKSCSAHTVNQENNMYKCISMETKIYFLITASERFLNII